VTTEEKLAEPISITLQFKQWCVIVAVLSRIIESSVPRADRNLAIQTEELARIREIIDRATD
tara:strand:- start:342 stop:527 length:186 start_codon:yes stop_codon:yes gene_type:complete